MLFISQPATRRVHREVRRWHGVLAVTLTMVARSLANGSGVADAETLLRSGQYEKVVTVAAQASLSADAVEEWDSLLIESLCATGEYAQALQAATNALAKHSASLRLRWLARDVFLANGDTNAAATMVGEILRRVETQPWAYRDAGSLLVIGKAALLLGVDPKQVLDRLFDAAKKADPASRDVYLACGELALEKHDFELAAKSFHEGLQKLADDPDLHYGLARAYAPSDTALMIASLEAALEHNSNHLGSLLLLADHSIDAENYEQAEELLEQVLTVNPWQPEAWAYRAVLRHLANDVAAEAEARSTALKFRATNPRVDHLIGLKLSQKYRFAEGAMRQYQALCFDPSYLPAKAQLAQDLLRLGREDEGWQLADEVQRADGYDVVANNLTVLQEVIADFVTLSNAHFVVRMHPSEATLYGQRVLELLESARLELCARYGVELPQPTLLEIFHEQKDFAVRTFGMPGNHGFLGVCFGSVITANSPGSRPGMRFNWESMVWHEFCHVVTLQLTGNKMPRWLSEGISVYEERRANPSWGERLTPRYREMLLGEDRTPVAELSAAFLMPRSAEHLQFAYYQSSLVVEYLVDRHGPEKLAAVLRELRTGTDIGAALEQHIAPMDEIEAGFATFAEQTARAFGPGLDWEKPDLETLLTAQASSNRAPRALLEMFSGSGGTRWDDWAASRPSNFWVMTRTAQRLVKEEKWAEAKPLVEQLIRSCPEFIGDDGAYAMLAGIHHALGEADAEREALTEWARRDDEALDAYRRLMELASETGDWSKVAEQARRYLAVDPLVPLPYRFLADAARELQELETAIRAYRALLELNPANPAEVHFRLATLLHQRGDPGARRHLLQALEDAPRYQEALRLLLDLNEAERGGEARTEPQQEPVQGGGIQRDGARVCDPQQDPQTGETGAGHDHHYAILSSAAAVEGAKGMLRDGSVHSVCESCCGSPTRGPRANLDPTANAPTKGGGGAGFPTCCIADFQVGRPCEIETSAGWETRDTADLEVCATVVAPSCVRGPQHLRVDPAPYPAWPVGNGTAGL